MGVIQFPRWPVYSYVDENRENVIRAWLDRNGVSSEMRNALQVYIDLVEHGGPAIVPGCIVSVGKGLEAFKAKRHEEGSVFLIFRRGVFAEQEITLLAGSRRPKETLSEAQANLRALERDRKRRKYEQITRTSARKLPG